MQQILIVEDEAIIRSALKRLLERHGYAVSEAESAEEADRLDPQRFDLVIADLRLPGEEGTVLIERAAPVPVLIMTSYASMRSAIDSLKQGAVDYIAKPFDHGELVETVSRILHQQAMRQGEPPEITDEGGDQQIMIGDCDAMQQVYTRIRKTAPADVTVLILGESGTGKELVARALHQQSKRAAASLVSVNCAAIPETLIESELFGHEKGAFTGASASRTGLVEAADGGTLFLDEIGELPLDAQARLLRVLQEGEIRKIGSVETRHVDVRLIAATHRDLAALSKSGEFRLDLYYRLNVMQIDLPPLRERDDDVLAIADILLDKALKRHGREGLRLSRAARQDLRDYPWPGNVRELENALERGVILAEGHLIHPDDLGLAPAATRPQPASVTPPQAPADEAPAEPPPGGTAEGVSLEDYFQHFVLEHQDHMSETELAQKLGISRKNLWERRQRLGIPRKKNARRSS
ncbi:sigma-54 dependent transcriptional regulator [Halomonas piscis]|uniref:Sigma-54 dependent transcriptional regulator n=1 Tax=Halomonas piscis TaxID=3031727 RepID=A0ABY9Z1U1_9GAMM|nr:sigma-54 dependent transcriptional regulator [Halomonas piscis]WNK20660.1 sigma-54 dependent transcriptional regulator [Halomonas piscis]